MGTYATVPDLVQQNRPVYGNFDIILDHLSQTSQLYTRPRARRVMYSTWHPCSSDTDRCHRMLISAFTPTLCPIRVCRYQNPGTGDYLYFSPPDVASGSTSGVWLVGQNYSLGGTVALKNAATASHPALCPTLTSPGAWAACAESGAWETVETITVVGGFGPAMCRDTEGAARGMYNDASSCNGLSSYSQYTLLLNSDPLCDRYEDEDWHARILCCACNGGEDVLNGDQHLPPPRACARPLRRCTNFSRPPRPASLALSSLSRRGCRVRSSCASVQMKITMHCCTPMQFRGLFSNVDPGN